MKSSGTKIVMSAPIVRQLCELRNTQTKKDIEDLFNEVFFHTPTFFCAAGWLP